MSWLSGNDLQKLVMKYGDEETRQAFMGIFAIDRLPSQVKQLPALLIINTHTVNLPGEHWKAIYISPEHRGEVFDSLNLPISIHLQRWLNTFTRRCSRSRRLIQNPLSSTCGAFTLFFVLTRLKCKSMEQCLKVFSPDVSQNDILIRNFVKDLK